MRKLLVRISPLVRMIRSGSGMPAVNKFRPINASVTSLGFTPEATILRTAVAISSLPP